MKMEPSPGNGGKTAPVKKTEKPVDNTKKENDELRALVKSQGDKIELLTKAVTHIAGTPIRKAVTSIAALKKTEDGKETKTPLTKAEMTSQLSAMVKGGKLSKNDKSKIEQFYNEGSTNLGLIAHLFQ